MATRGEEVRVLVADDHLLFRRGLVVELDDAGGLEVVAEASSGEEAVETASALAPHVVLMDVQMPGIGGIEATRRLVELMPSIRVLMLSVSDDGDDLFDAVRAGAAGYLLKETPLVEIADAARRVAEGHSFVSPPLAGRLLHEFAQMGAKLETPTESGRRTIGLTDSEVLVLEAMAAGADNGAIAEATGLSAGSTRNHVRNILEKLELFSRTEAVMYAMRARVIDP